MRTGIAAGDIHFMLDASTIIVNWNSKRYLAKCLDSIRRHHRDCTMEVIVVDNASSDGAVEELKQEYPEIQWIANTENVGFARANNMGMEKASGRYVCLVNPDVEFLDNCLGKICRYMNTHADVGVCGPRILNGDGTIQYSCREYPTLWNNFCFSLGLHRLLSRHSAFSNELMSYFDHNRLREVQAISGCFMVVRREALRDVGLLDEAFFMYSEDLDWCKRFKDKGWKIVFNPEVSAVHYGGKSSDNAPARFAVEIERAKIKYWKKHHGIIKNILIRIILLSHHALRIATFGVLRMSGAAESEGRRLKIQTHVACFKSLVHMK